MKRYLVVCDQLESGEVVAEIDGQEVRGATPFAFDTALDKLNIPHPRDIVERRYLGTYLRNRESHE